MVLTLAMVPVRSQAGVAYRFDITTAYATANPFPNRLDSAFTASDTGYLQIANAGTSDYHGIIRTIAQSPFAGDMGYNLADGTIPAGGSVSIAMANDSSDVGGFNGPAYFFRPGVIIYLEGTVGGAPVKLAVADLDIHSGVFRTDPNGLVTDNFVLQGGDPFGFDNGDAFELNQAWGHITLAGVAVPEAGTVSLLTLALGALLLARGLHWQNGRVQRYTDR